MTGQTVLPVPIKVKSISIIMDAAFPKAAHGTIHLDPPTNLGSRLIDAAVSLYAQITSPQLLVRRISIAANRVIEDHGIYQLNLFTDMKKLERVKKAPGNNAGYQKAVWEKFCVKRHQHFWTAPPCGSETDRSEVIKLNCPFPKIFP